MNLETALETLARADKKAMAAGDLNAYRNETVDIAAKTVLNANLPTTHVLYVDELLWGGNILANDVAHYALSA